MKLLRLQHFQLLRFSTHNYLLLYLFYPFSPTESMVCPQCDLQSLFWKFISYFLPLLISLNCGNPFINFLNCTVTSIFNSLDFQSCLPYQCYFLTIFLPWTIGPTPKSILDVLFHYSVEKPSSIICEQSSLFSNLGGKCIPFSSFPTALFF